MKKIHFFNHKFPPCFSVTARPSIRLSAVILASVIGLIIANPVLATSWETTSLRTAGGGLIRIGMPRQEVLKELGQAKQTRRNASANGKTGKRAASVNYRGSDGLYTITFSGERVARIVVTPNRD